MTNDSGEMRLDEGAMFRCQDCDCEYPMAAMAPQPEGNRYCPNPNISRCLGCRSAYRLWSAISNSA